MGQDAPHARTWRLGAATGERGCGKGAHALHPPCCVSGASAALAAVHHACHLAPAVIAAAAAHHAATPPAPHTLQALAHHAARRPNRLLQPPVGVRYRSSGKHLLIPRLRWAAAMRHATSSAQLALLLRGFDEAVDWEGLKKPANDAFDPKWWAHQGRGRVPAAT